MCAGCSKSNVCLAACVGEVDKVCGCLGAVKVTREWPGVRQGSMDTNVCVWVDSALATGKNNCFQ